MEPMYDGYWEDRWKPEDRAAPQQVSKPAVDLDAQEGDYNIWYVATAAPSPPQPNRNYRHLHHLHRCHLHRHHHPPRSFTTAAAVLPPTTHPPRYHKRPGQKRGRDDGALPRGVKSPNRCILTQHSGKTRGATPDTCLYFARGGCHLGHRCG